MEKAYLERLGKKSIETAVIPAICTPTRLGFFAARLKDQSGFGSADQEVSAKANGRKHGDAQHDLFVPAHPLLRLAHCQGAHDRHGSPSLLSEAFFVKRISQSFEPE